jgi:hypothetical protein
MARNPKPQTDPAPPRPAEPPAPMPPATEPSPPATDAAAAATMASSESTLGDGDAKGAEMTSPQGSTAPDASAPGVVTDPGATPTGGAPLPEGPVSVSAVPPDTPAGEMTEVTLLSAVDHDGMRLKDGTRLVLKNADADALVRAGAASPINQD